MKYFFYSCLTLILSTPFILFAQTDDGGTGNRVEYTNSLVQLPGYDSGGTASFSGFIELIYGLSISIAALLAVVKIVIAGLKWMLSADVVTDKADAKKDIQGALIGLIIIISAVLIIYTINPTIIGAQ